MGFCRPLATILVLSLFCFSTMWADKMDEKIYISEDAIVLFDDMIIFSAYDEVAVANAFFTDKNGLFVLAKDVQLLREKWGDRKECARDSSHSYPGWMDRMGGCPRCEKKENTKRREERKRERRREK